MSEYELLNATNNYSSSASSKNCGLKCLYSVRHMHTNYYRLCA